MRLDGILFIVALSIFIWVLWLFWMGARTKRKNEEASFEEKPKRKRILELKRDTFEHTHFWPDGRTAAQGEVENVHSWTTKWEGNLSPYDRKELLKRSYSTQEAKDAIEEEYQTKVLGNPPIPQPGQNPSHTRMTK